MPSSEAPSGAVKTAPSTFANLGRMAGAVGLVLCASSPLTWILTTEMGLLVWGKLAIGSFLIALYLLTNRDFFARVAGSKSLGLMTLSALSMVFVLGLVGAVNWAAVRYPYERDMTREGLYTLSSQTHRVVGNLKTDVHIYAFYVSYEQLYPLVDDMLNRYQHLGTRLHYEMVDPQARPDLTERYQITDRGPRLVVVARDQDARAKDLSEQALTNAIVKVAEQTSKKVYVLRGHGELEPDDPKLAEGAKQFLDAIGTEGYETAPLDLRAALPTPAQGRIDLKDFGPGKAPPLTVPQDAAVVLILGPMHPLLAPEAAALSAYLNTGGRLMVLLEPHVKTGLESLLRDWRIEVRDDLIVDTNPLNRLLGLGAAAPMVQPVHGEHPIVAHLESAMIMSTARSVVAMPEGAQNIEVTPLAHTAETAWGETRMGKNGTAQKDEQDHLPPLFVAMAAEQTVAQQNGPPDLAGTQRSSLTRLLVFGDSDFVSNKYLSMQGNQDFALNGLNWLTEQDTKITIRPKNRAASQLFLSGNQMNTVKFVCMDILPVLIIAAGLGITLVRRQR